MLSYLSKSLPFFKAQLMLHVLQKSCPSTEECPFYVYNALVVRIADLGGYLPENLHQTSSPKHQDNIEEDASPLKTTALKEQLYIYNPPSNP